MIGIAQGAPLTLVSAIADGWLLLASGAARIGSFVAPLRELGGPAAFAVVVTES